MGITFGDEAEVSSGPRRKRWSYQVLVRQTELCSVNVTLDSKLTVAKLRQYVILLILHLL